MDQRKKWQATKIVVSQKFVSRELYEAQIHELARVLYDVFNHLPTTEKSMQENLTIPESKSTDLKNKITEAA